MLGSGNFGVDSAGRMAIVMRVVRLRPRQEPILLPSNLALSQFTKDDIRGTLVSLHDGGGMRWARPTRVGLDSDSSQQWYDCRRRFATRKCCTIVAR